MYKNYYKTFYRIDTQPHRLDTLISHNGNSDNYKLSTSTGGLDKYSTRVWFV